MAYKPVYGYATSNPVTKLDGTPVVMVSPKPFSQWDYAKSESNATVTAGSGFAKATATSGAGISGSAVSFSMLYVGTGTLTFAVTSSTVYAIGSAVIRTYVESDVIGGPLTITVGGTTSGTLSVPYYRYRILINFSITGTWVAGDWVNVAVTLS